MNKKKYRWLVLPVTLVLTACGPQIPTDAALSQLFLMHEQRFLEAEQLCFAYPELRAIEVDGDRVETRSDSYGKSVLINDRDTASVLSFLKETGLLQISCHYLYVDQKSHLTSISFTAYAVGISVSGRIKGIKRLLNKKLGNERLQQDLRNNEVRPLPREDWYIYEPK